MLGCSFPKLYHRHFFVSCSIIENKKKLSTSFTARATIVVTSSCLTLADIVLSKQYLWTDLRERIFPGNISFNISLTWIYFFFESKPNLLSNFHLRFPYWLIGYKAYSLIYLSPNSLQNSCSIGFPKQNLSSCRAPIFWHVVKIYPWLHSAFPVSINFNSF